MRIELSIIDISELEQNTLIKNIANECRSSEVETVLKGDQTAQDIGSILICMLSAPAIIQLCRGIADTLRLSRKASLMLKGKNGETLEIKNAKASDVAELSKILIENKQLFEE